MYTSGVGSVNTHDSTVTPSMRAGTAGQEPMTVRLYARDHDAIKAMGKAGGLFVRNAIRKAVQEQAQLQQ